MLSFADASSAALSELAAFTRRLREIGADGWRRPTLLPGWRVEDLARHVAAVAWQQAEAFHRARLRIAEAPSYLVVHDEAPVLPITIDVARDHLEAGILRLDATDEPPVPLPFATLPASFAAYVVLIEYGTHRSDLEGALGGDASLRAPVASTVVELIGGMLPMLAGEHPKEPTTYRLIAPAATTTISWVDDGWRSDVDNDPDVTIAGADSAVASFALGRIDRSHPSLAVSGDTAVADAFKKFFPGP